METIAKIGRAALSRLFSSAKFCAGSVGFPKADFDLAGVVGRGHFNDHYGDVQTVGGTSYCVWGIELGLRHLETVEGKTFAEAVVELLKKENGNELKQRHWNGSTVFPSHIIRYSWIGGDLLDGRETTYTVYRLSQKQELEIVGLLTPVAKV